MSELFDWIKSLGGLKPSFKPHIFHNKYGDMIHYLAEEKEFYSEWVDRRLSLFIDRETEKVIGVELRGVSHMFDGKEPNP